MRVSEASKGEGRYRVELRAATVKMFGSRARVRAERASHDSK
jgi:hypothetical protein